MEQSQNRSAGAIILIVVGVFFLLGQFFGFSIGSLFAFSWPFWVILPGAVMLAAAFFGSKQMSGLVVPGAIVTGTGVLLLFQDATGYYESWAYVWTLYPVFIGSALWFMGRRTGSDDLARRGTQSMMGGLGMFVIFGGFFELFIWGGHGLARFIVPLLLIGGGVLLLTGGRLPFLSDGDSDKVKNEEKARLGDLVNGDAARRAPSDVDPALQREIDDALRRDRPDTDDENAPRSV